MFKKGMRVEITHKGKSLYGVVFKGGSKNITVIFDGGDKQITAPVHLFRLSDHPLPKDKPSVMDEYTVSAYKDLGMGLDNLMFKAIILRDGKPVLSVQNSGDGGCNHYSPLDNRNSLDQFYKDTRAWVTQFGYPDMIEPEDTWVDWYVNMRPYGVLAEKYIMDYKKRMNELLRRNENEKEN